MSEPADSWQNLTDDQIRRQVAKRQIMSMVWKMREAALRLEHLAERFDGEANASNIVADVVQEVMQIGGSMGSHAWGLVRELGTMPDPPKS